MEVPRAVYHHIELAAHVVAVLGVNAGEPHIERVIGMLGGQVKIAHGINRPLRFAGIEVKDKRIARLGAHGDRLEHPVVAGRLIGDRAHGCVVFLRLLHTVHELVAIHFAVGVHGHLATRIASEWVDARAAKAKASDHGRFAARCCLDKVGARPLQALLEFGFICRGGYEYKFVSTDTEQQVIGFHCLGECTADAQDVAIALGVAKRIVAMLKAIDIDISAGEGGAFVPKQLGITVESSTVAKIGERIDIGAALKQLAFLLQDGKCLL